jgi:hypothetical protein
MNFKLQLLITTLTSVIMSMTAWASGQLPQIQVSAQVSGTPFKNLVVENNVPKLLQSIISNFAEEASKIHPCVEWTISGENASSPVPSAHLILLFERVEYYNSYRIKLSFKSPNTSSRAMTFIIITPLEEIIRPTGSQQILSILTKRIDEELQGDELQAYLTTEIIRHLPMTSAVQIDEKGQRVVVPINAKRLRLAADSPLFVDIKGQPFCSARPEDCEVRLLSLGPSYVQPFDLLWCRPEDSDCCRPLPWSVTRKLQAVRDKQVFLGEDHRHCPSFQKHCRFKGLSWEMDSSLQGGSHHD